VFSWIYDVPSLLAIVAFGVAFMGIFWLGALILRPLIRKWLHREEGLNSTLGDYLQYFGVIYGLLLGLLAVGAYQNHADAERAVVTEAAALAALYRDVSGVSRAIPHRSQDARARVRTFAHRGRVATAASRHSPSP
jgi:nitrate reductase gamma subunit